MHGRRSYVKAPKRASFVRMRTEALSAANRINYTIRKKISWDLHSMNLSFAHLPTYNLGTLIMLAKVFNEYIFR